MGNLMERIRRMQDAKELMPCPRCGRKRWRRIQRGNEALEAAASGGPAGTETWMVVKTVNDAGLDKTLRVKELYDEVSAFVEEVA